MFHHVANALWRLIILTRAPLTDPMGVIELVEDTLTIICPMCQGRYDIRVRKGNVPGFPNTNTDLRVSLLRSLVPRALHMPTKLPPDELFVDRDGCPQPPIPHVKYSTYGIRAYQIHRLQGTMQSQKMTVYLYIDRLIFGGIRKHSRIIRSAGYISKQEYDAALVDLGMGREPQRGVPHVVVKPELPLVIPRPD
jgi:hypothetical protein